ncbi:hypothetical protein [Microvirga massiliensis]|uniref:hypothetical protein n=1 Tax=Microvirga massiliensis TaxID=1033741 RepID=UPI000661490C|nr:hypothetical protein [Microvirga massiliensis]
MTAREDLGLNAQDFPPDHPQRLLIQAYARLPLFPERVDGSKQASIASFGAYDLRLSELSPAMGLLKAYPLQVELCESITGRIIDRVGCQNLRDASRAVEAFIAVILRLGKVAPPECPCA